MFPSAIVVKTTNVYMSLTLFPKCTMWANIARMIKFQTECSGIDQDLIFIMNDIWEKSKCFTMLSPIPLNWN